MEINFEQYSIIIVNLDPTIGQEIKKTRPCVVISPDEMNRHLGTVVVAPVISSKSDYPTRVVATINRKRSSIAVDQIRAIDKRRIYKVKGKLKPETVIKLKSVIRMAYVD